MSLVRTSAAIEPRLHLQLRRSADRLLMDVQRLPGFSAKREKLPRPPEFAEAWTFAEIRRACHRREIPTSAAGEVPRWVWRPASLASRSQVELAECRGDVTHSHLSERLVLVEGRVVEPTAKDLNALTDYRDSIEAFSDDFLWRCQWGARAVHRSLQTWQIIGLPQARPRPMRLASPILVNLDLPADDRIDALDLSEIIESLESLLDDLKLAEVHPAADALEENRDQVRDEIHGRLAALEANTRSATVDALREQVDAWHRRRTPSASRSSWTKCFDSALKVHGTEIRGSAYRDRCPSGAGSCQAVPSRRSQRKLERSAAP